MSSKVVIFLPMIIVVLLVTAGLMLIFSVDDRKRILDSSFISENSTERIRALDSLRSGGEESIPVLAEGLEDSNPRIRAGCASLLGEIKGERAVELLLGALDDSEASVQIAAIGSLGRIKDGETWGKPGDIIRVFLPQLIIRQALTANLLSVPSVPLWLSKRSLSQQS